MSRRGRIGSRGSAPTAWSPGARKFDENDFPPRILRKSVLRQPVKSRAAKGQRRVFAGVRVRRRLLPNLGSRLTTSNSPFPRRLSARCSFPPRGRAAPWRLYSPVSACLTRSRTRGRLTGMQTPLDPQPRAKPRLAFIAHRGRTRRAIDLRNPDREARLASRRPAFPAMGTLALRRSTWDFWPGPVRAVVRHALRDRAATSYAARVIVTRRSRSREPPRRGR